MRYLHIIIYIAVTLLVFTSGVQAQNIKVEVNAPDQVNAGENFYVRYTVKSNEDKELKPEFEIGDIKNFDILYGAAKSEGKSLTVKNGVKSSEVSITYSYHLQAKKAGKYTLPVAKAVIDGKTYKSEKHHITVTGQPGNTRENNAPTKEADKAIISTDKLDIFAKTILSRESASTSDTLMLTYRIYYNDNNIWNKLQQIKTDFAPLAKDFYSRDITPAPDFTQKEKINGKEYFYYDIRRLILQPRSEGTKKIAAGSITILLNIPTGKKEKSFFGEVDIYKTETLKVKLDEATVNVMNLVGI